MPNLDVDRLRRPSWATLALAVVVAGAGSYYFGKTSTQSRDALVAGEMAFSSFSDQLAALHFLSKGDTENAKRALKTSIDAEVLRLVDLHTPHLDEHAPKRKAELFAIYRSMRSQSPTVDYADNGQMDANVNKALANAAK